MNDVANDYLIDMLGARTEELLEVKDQLKQKEKEVEILKNRITRAKKYIVVQSRTNKSLNGLLVDYEIEELLQILEGK